MLYFYNVYVIFFYVFGESLKYCKMTHCFVQGTLWFSIPDANIEIKIITAKFIYNIVLFFSKFLG